MIWDQLDQMKASTSQLGDEQVLDVELDKRTELMPARTEYEEFRWDRPQRTPSAAAAADVPGTPNISIVRVVVLLTTRNRICPTPKLSHSTLSPDAERSERTFAQSFGASI